MVWASLVAQRVKALACHAGDPGSIPGTGRSPEKEMATHSGTLAWRIPWAEKGWGGGRYEQEVPVFHN